MTVARYQWGPVVAHFLKAIHQGSMNEPALFCKDAVKLSLAHEELYRTCENPAALEVACRSSSRKWNEAYMIIDVKPLNAESGIEKTLRQITLEIVA